MPRDWNMYYAIGEQEERPPESLLVQAIQGRLSGRALDLACGLGRNALFLAAQGWEVTAVDASPVAIDILRERASEGPPVHAVVADLESGEFVIQPDAWDLIVDCKYLQRSLFPSIRDGIRAGGFFVGVIPMEGINPAFCMDAGEGRELFAGWKLLHYEEGSLMKIIAEKP
jgi:tellurite methyltransferase